MRGELQYSGEGSPCCGASADSVDLQVSEESSQPVRIRWQSRASDLIISLASPMLSSCHDHRGGLFLLFDG
jgi:hypothetical protein